MNTLRSEEIGKADPEVPREARLPAFKVCHQLGVGLSLNSDGRTYRLDGTVDPTVTQWDQRTGAQS